MIFRQGTIEDLNGIQQLALTSWAQFQSELTPENWKKLHDSLSDEKTFTDLLELSFCFLGVDELGRVIGMSFLVPSGNPTEIFDKSWCYIRYVTVDPTCSGRGIGRKLTELCIDYAVKSGEHTVALHTSDMMDKARYLYERLGFTIVKEIEPRLGKKYFLYTLRLPQ